MRMADIGEQVVLYLKIKSADKPGEKTALRGEIRCCLELVYRPVVFHFTLCISHWKSAFGHYMGTLEYQRQKQSGYVLHHCKPE